MSTYICLHCDSKRYIDQATICPRAYPIGSWCVASEPVTDFDREAEASWS